MRHNAGHSTDESFKDKTRVCGYKRYSWMDNCHPWKDISFREHVLEIYGDTKLCNLLLLLHADALCQWFLDLIVRF